MSQDQLLTAILAFHSSILVSAVVAYHKYGDRTELFQKSLDGTNSILERLLRLVSSDLEQRLAAVFAVQDEPRKVVLLTDELYDKPVSPVGSETYREAIRDFVVSSGEGLKDCFYLMKLRDAWCRWAKRLSWTMLVLVIWQVIASSLVWSQKIFSLNLPEWSLKVSASITGVLLIAVLVSVVVLQHHHSGVLDLRQKHGPY